MRYLLVVVTHGRSPHFADALAAFRNQASPHPARGLLWVDGPDENDAASRVIEASGAHDWEFTGSADQRGFCTTVADAWVEAAEVAYEHECPYVFWLESDFILTRLVDLEAMAQLLDTEHGLAQVALMRNAVADHEIAAGGLYESRPGEWQEQLLMRTVEPVLHSTRMRGYPWLRQQSYFTTNPSLMRTEFMAWNHWPADGQPECEGRYGIELRERGFDFAAWGSGEPWCAHIGTRSGFGY